VHAQGNEEQHITNETYIIYFLYSRGFDKNSSRDDQVNRILEMFKDQKTKDRRPRTHKNGVLEVLSDGSHLVQPSRRHHDVFGEGMPCNTTYS
jgi:hypothetical protein